MSSKLLIRITSVTKNVKSTLHQQFTFTDLQLQTTNVNIGVMCPPKFFSGYDPDNLGLRS